MEKEEDGEAEEVWQSAALARKCWRLLNVVRQWLLTIFAVAVVEVAEVVEVSQTCSVLVVVVVVVADSEEVWKAVADW